VREVALIDVDPPRPCTAGAAAEAQELVARRLARQACAVTIPDAPQPPAREPLDPLPAGRPDLLAADLEDHPVEGGLGNEELLQGASDLDDLPVWREIQNDRVRGVRGRVEE
jgi:hypothetical protein